MTRILLKPRKARPFFGRHPWVLDSAIDRIEGSPADGDVVDLCGEDKRFIARGIFNSRSRIHVRLYTWNEAEPLDDAFWRRRLETALQLRSVLDCDPPEAPRLVFSEGDGLSGLIVDRYAGYLVVQVTALAMAVRLPQIVPMLVDLARPQGILLRTERDIVRAEGLDLAPGLAWGRDAGRAGRDPRPGVVLRGRPGGRAEDGPLSRPAREPHGRRPLHERPPPAGHVLLHGRLQPGGGRLWARPARRWGSIPVNGRWPRPGPTPRVTA